MQNNLSMLTKAAPQVLKVLGGIKNGNIDDFIDNICKTQNIPIDDIRQQAQGIINLFGEQNIKNFLNQFGFKL